MTSISNVGDLAETITVDWDDGDKLDVIVRAIDVMGVYDQEIVTVYHDATPPIIENMWLTRGKRTNVFIHNIEDFTEMTYADIFLFFKI